jgi:hypothetical protein
MYLLKHICIELNSVINQLIGAKIHTTAAYLFSPSTTSQVRLIAGAAMKSNNGHVNTKNIHNIAIPNHRVNQLRITITGGMV